jgi:hypothetical protein
LPEDGPWMWGRHWSPFQRRVVPSPRSSCDGQALGSCQLCMFDFSWSCASLTSEGVEEKWKRKRPSLYAIVFPRKWESAIRSESRGLEPSAISCEPVWKDWKLNDSW